MLDVLGFSFFDEFCRICRRALLVPIPSNSLCSSRGQGTHCHRLLALTRRLALMDHPSGLQFLKEGKTGVLLGAAGRGGEEVVPSAVAVEEKEDWNGGMLCTCSISWISLSCSDFTF